MNVPQEVRLIRTADYAFDFPRIEPYQGNNITAPADRIRRAKRLKLAGRARDRRKIIDPNRIVREQPDGHLGPDHQTERTSRRQL